MFNSPVLEVTIGLVLIFLLYSLLATTINEMIAMIFGLRARMLRNAIADHLLANAPRESRWSNILRGVFQFFAEIPKLLFGKTKTSKGKIGDHFYDHPLIRNYGSTRVFPIPSYIPARNFSTVLIDLMRKEFQARQDEILSYKLSQTEQVDETMLRDELQLSTDLVKIKEVLDYYSRAYLNANVATNTFFLDAETVGILQLHLRQSGYQLEQFIRTLETWFDDMMNRVSGWYKRQTQTVLFFLGLILAGMFNVDSIEIANHLSVDKAARGKMVDLAVQSIETYKNDPRILQGSNADSTPQSSSSFIVYQHKMDSLVKAAQHELSNANNILALGWGNNAPPQDVSFYSKSKRAAGWLLTAFAICLGAPFWFDLLNKLVRLRSTGKKEDDDLQQALIKSRNAVVPIILNTQTNDKAVG